MTFAKMRKGVQVFRAAFAKMRRSVWVFREAFAKMRRSVWVFRIASWRVSAAELICTRPSGRSVRVIGDSRGTGGTKGTQISSRRLLKALAGGQGGELVFVRLRLCACWLTC